MIPRYTRPAMGRIWSDENKYRCWLRVETAASQALATFGLVPQSAADAIPRQGRLYRSSHRQIEAEVRHDVIAFTTTVAEHIADPEASRWLHYGLNIHGCCRYGAVPPTQGSLGEHSRRYPWPRGDAEEAST